MKLWIHWWTLMWELRPACSRLRTFLWFATCVAGLSIRTDIMGVTSIVRALGLERMYYNRLLDTFHSSGIKLDKLATLWARVVLRFFAPQVVRINGRIVLVGDGIKIPKRGKKMPGVKLIHQQSESNTKPEYIMGHSFQAIALLVGAAKGVFAVPLVSRIHEGVVFSNRDTRTLLDKMVTLIHSLAILEPFYFVADAYYASRKVIQGLLISGNHLVTRVKSNAVAYHPAVQQQGRQRKRGRPKKYGTKLKVRALLKDRNSMQTAQSPVYGETKVTLSFRSLDLRWRPVGSLVRFVAVCHPSRGSCILMSTDLSLPPLEIIRLYGLRFKIEISFKQAVRTIGVYAYHFWLRAMKPLKRRQGNQYLHRESDDYRRLVIRKMNTYHRFVQAGIVAQGALQYLAAVFPQLVWNSFRSWIRTIRPGVPPSEMVVASALRSAYPYFLSTTSNPPIFTKFLASRIDSTNSYIFRLAG